MNLNFREQNTHLENTFRKGILRKPVLTLRVEGAAGGWGVAWCLQFLSVTATIRSDKNI